MTNDGYILKSDMRQILHQSKTMAQVWSGFDGLEPVAWDRPIGKWLNDFGKVMCSLCYNHSPDDSNYCPKCGAKMDRVYIRSEKNG